MSEERTPQSWVGRRVEALIVHAWGMSGQYGVPTNRSLTAGVKEGVLEEVNDLGIVATFKQEVGPTFSEFYPWSAVLRLRPLE